MATKAIRTKWTAEVAISTGRGLKADDSEKGLEEGIRRRD
jgi:hypothetical protein